MNIPFQNDRPIFVGLRFPGHVYKKAEQWAERLERAGFDVRIKEGAGTPKFKLRIKHPAHPSWGKAYVWSDPAAPRVDDIYFQISPKLDDDARDAALAGRVDLTVVYKPVAGNLLRDKKTLLRFARAVMGDDAIALVDTFSTLVWTRFELDNELQHDAELDVESLYAIHAIADEDALQEKPARKGTQDDDEDDDGPPISWMHTHGVAELGGFDIDILRPHASFARGADIVRALVFAAVEGTVAPDEPEYPAFMPGGEVRLVPVREFHEQADEKDAYSRVMDEAHGSNRSVLCDLAGAGKKKKFGLTFGKSGGAAVRSAQCFQRPLPDGIISPFTNAASELMARRAVATFDLFASLREEFADLKVGALVKLAIPTDTSKREKTDDCEHMWFDVHGLRGGKLDATLINSPRDVSGMQEGARGVHSTELLSDWTIMTPAGPMNPRNMRVAYMLRGLPADVRRQLAEALAKED